MRGGERKADGKQELIGSLRGETAHPSCWLYQDVSFVRSVPRDAALMAFILGRRSRGCQRVYACLGGGGLFVCASVA